MVTSWIYKWCNNEDVIKIYCPKKKVLFETLKIHLQILLSYLLLIPQSPKVSNVS